MSKKNSKENRVRPYFMCRLSNVLHQKPKIGSDPIFGFVQIRKAVFANYQRQPHTATVIKAIFRVRTTCELRELPARLGRMGAGRGEGSCRVEDRQGEKARSGQTTPIKKPSQRKRPSQEKELTESAALLELHRSGLVTLLLIVLPTKHERMTVTFRNTCFFDNAKNINSVTRGGPANGDGTGTIPNAVSICMQVVIQSRKGRLCAG